MDWAILVGSGVFEAVWAVALGKSDGFRKLGPLAVFVLGSVLSLAGLGYAMRSLPTGTAYAVWTATGASLTVVYGILTGQERASLARIALLAGIVGCVIGLKLVA